MIFKIIKKMTFIGKLKKDRAENFLRIIIKIDEFFWRARLFFFSTILGKKSKISKALDDLRNFGVAVVPNFYTENKASEIKSKCLDLLDQSERLGISTANQRYSSWRINSSKDDRIDVEKVSNQIKIKGIHKINKYFKSIGRDFKTNLITLAYHLSLSKPYLIYNFYHDGKSDYNIFVEEGKKTETIAGVLHIDSYLHELRMCVALEDVTKENGPTLCYKNSMSLNAIKENHLNIALEKFKFHNDKNIGHYVNNEKIKHLENNAQKVYVTAKKGDLVLLDLKNAHCQSLLKKGERHLLWFFF